MSQGNSFASINFSDPEAQSVFKYREQAVCDKWRESEYPMKDCLVKTLEDREGSSFIVKGTATGGILLRSGGDIYVKYWAANPPTFGSSYAGSGLPYPTEAVAYENSPNSGVIRCEGGSFTFKLAYPNSYYKNMGTVLVPPQVRLQYCDKDGKKLSKIYTVKLGNPIPFRTLTWPTQRNWNDGPLYYYNRHLPVRTQEQILANSAYPAENVMPKNFWGLRPPK